MSLSVKWKNKLTANCSCRCAFHCDQTNWTTERSCFQNGSIGFGSIGNHDTIITRCTLLAINTKSTASSSSVSRGRHGLSRDFKVGYCRCWVADFAVSFLSSNANVLLLVSQVVTTARLVIVWWNGTSGLSKMPLGATVRSQIVVITLILSDRDGPSPGGRCSANLHGKFITCWTCINIHWKWNCVRFIYFCLNQKLTVLSGISSTQNWGWISSWVGDSKTISQAWEFKIKHMT